VSDVEEPLEGGVIGAVRVGDTVRKPAGPWTPTVQALLRHLADVGFEMAPAPLGLDGAGRETFSYIEGEPAFRPWPQALFEERGVVALASLTRRFHDAVAAFRPADPIWRIGPRPLRDDEIVCHGDLGPWNTIWRDGHIVGLIDWDLAEPGPPLLDIAFLALQLIPLRHDRYAAEAGFDREVPRAERLRILCETYGGGVRPEDVLRQVRALHERDLERTLGWGADGKEPWASFLRQGDVQIVRDDLAWLSANEAGLVSESYCSWNPRTLPTRTAPGSDSHFTV